MASRFNKKLNITIEKRNSKDDAKSLAEFIEEADHIDSNTDLSTAFPALRHGINQRLSKDSSR